MNPKDPSLEPEYQLLPWYLNGSLSEEERGQVEAWLRTNPAAATELEAWKKISAALTSRPSLSPSPVTRARLLARVRSRIDRPRLLGWKQAVSAASLSLLILSLLWLALRPGMVLQWSAEGSGLSSFRIYRTTLESRTFQFVGELPVQSPAQTYTYVDMALIPGRQYIYRVQGVSRDGTTVFSQPARGDSLELLPGQVAILLTSLILGYSLTLWGQAAKVEWRRLLPG